MTKKKKHQLGNILAKNRELNLKKPELRLTKSDTSTSAATASAHTSNVAPESVSARMNTQSKRVVQGPSLIVLPEVPFDIVGWKEDGLKAVAHDIEQFSDEHQMSDGDYYKAPSSTTRTIECSVPDEPSVPRKRGRPRKYVVPVAYEALSKKSSKSDVSDGIKRSKKGKFQSDTVTIGYSGEDGPLKSTANDKKRDRPMKFLAPPYYDGIAAYGHLTEQADNGVAAKRPRGRPKKDKTSTDKPLVLPNLAVLKGPNVTASTVQVIDLQSNYSTEQMQAINSGCAVFAQCYEKFLCQNCREHRYTAVPDTTEIEVPDDIVHIPVMPPSNRNQMGPIIPYGVKTKKDNSGKLQKKSINSPPFNPPPIYHLWGQFPISDEPTTSTGKKSKRDVQYEANMFPAINLEVDPQPETENLTELRRSARVMEMAESMKSALTVVEPWPFSSSSSEPTQSSVNDPNYELPDFLARQMDLPRPGSARTISDAAVPEFRNPTKIPDFLKTAEEKRNWRDSVKNKTFNIARGILPGEVKPLCVGKLDDCSCTNCKALLFGTEVTKLEMRGGMFKCCQRGKVQLPQHQPYPPELRKLIVDHNNVLRLLNARVGLVAVHAKRVPLRGWPFIYKVQGQIHAEMQHAEPLPDPSNMQQPGQDVRNPRNLNDLDRRMGAQLSAFVDPALASREILQRPGGEKLDAKLLDAFLEFLHAHNPHFQMFTKMHDLIAAQEASGKSVEVTLVFLTPGQDKVTLREHTHRLPVEMNDVAALFDVGGVPETPCIYIHRHGRTFEVLPTHPHRDSFMYPVLYPYGEMGWHMGLEHKGPRRTKIRNRVTLREYILYKLYRRNPRQIELSCGALTQQYVVDSWVRVQCNDLNYLQRKLPQELMVATRGDLCKLLERVAEEKEYDIGRSIVLPTSYRGGEEFMERQYRHCIETLRVTGVPSDFLTMTANPNHPDMLSHPDLRRKDGSYNMDVVCRVFRLQVQDLVEQILDKKILGNVTNLIYVTEFQKRGLPHIHMVITREQKMNTPDDVDSVVTCRMPDPETEPELYKRVTKYMIHKCTARCLDEKNRCTKGFPFNFREETVMDDGHGWIALKRPRGGHTFTKGGKTYDTRNVVPYNPYLLLRYDCHINMLPFHNLKQARYIFKYICKGIDCACVEKTMKLFDHIIKDPAHPTRLDKQYAAMRVVDEKHTHDPPEVGPTAVQAPVGTDAAEEARSGGGHGSAKPAKKKVMIDMIKFHQDMQYMTASEAMWHLLGFPMYYNLFCVVELAVHTEEKTPVIFVKGKPLSDLDLNKNTPMLNYFKLNRESVGMEREFLKTIKFVQLPETYLIDKVHEEKIWRKKKHCNKRTIGCLYPVSPKYREQFFLRALMQKKTFPLGYEDLRTIDGKMYLTFREAAVALGLCRDDKEYENCLQEAALGGSPYSMRMLFVMLVLHCTPTDPKKLLDMFWEYMIGPNWSKERLLRFLARKFKMNNAEPDAVLFEGIDVENLDGDDDVLEEDEGPETFVTPSQTELDDDYARLNPEQREVVDVIEKSVDESIRNPELKDRLFLLTGEAGSGKTTLYNVLYKRLRARGRKVMCVAYTGTAASLLPGGKTLHSAFGLPVPLTKKSVSRLQPFNQQYENLKDVDLLIIDECTMAPQAAYTVASKLMQRVRGATEYDDSEFGGCPTLGAGDFRQLCPIPGRGELEWDVHLKHSAMFKKFTKLTLTRNMRTDPTEIEFAGLLKSIGEGRQPTHPCLPEMSFLVPNEWVIASGELDHLIEWCFEGNYSVAGEGCAILTHMNKHCTLINNQIISKMTGEEHILYSEDSIVDDDPDNPLMDADSAATAHKTHVTPEMLHGETPSGMPHHELRLKVGAIAILIRNLDVSAGLTNGLRLRIVKVSRLMVRAEAISGGLNIKGKTFDMSRINFEGELEATIRMRRTQFPLRLAFAMTINKSQGMTLEKVGVYLPHYVTDHGKMYVALSRVRRSSAIKMIIVKDSRQGYHTGLAQWFTHNPVKRQLWDLSLDDVPMPDPDYNPHLAVTRAYDDDIVEYVPAIPDDACDDPAAGESDEENGFVVQPSSRSQQGEATDKNFYEDVSSQAGRKSPLTSAAAIRMVSVPQSASAPRPTEIIQLDEGRYASPFSSPVMRRLRGNITPETSPVLNPNLKDSPSVHLLQSSPELSPQKPQMSPDCLASKVHDPRQTASQSEAPVPRHFSQESRESSVSVPAFLDSSMIKNTLLGDELCDSRNCFFCYKAKLMNLGTTRADVGSIDPHFDMYYEKISLLPTPEEFKQEIGSDDEV